MLEIHIVLDVPPNEAVSNAHPAHQFGQAGLGRVHAHAPRCPSAWGDTSASIDQAGVRIVDDATTHERQYWANRMQFMDIGGQ